MMNLLSGISRIKVALVVILVFLIFSALVATPVVQDDAMITYRYVWNLLHGHGLVPSIGATPVEAYSNSLLMFLTTMTAYCTGLKEIDQVVSIGVVINRLSAIGILLLILHWCKREKSKYYWLPPALLACFYPFVWAPACGMETGLHALVILVMVYSFTYGHHAMAIAAALLTTLSRPEGFIPAGACIAAFLLLAHLQHKLRMHVRLVCLGYVIPFGLFLLGRQWYFHSLVANSVVVKYGLRTSAETILAGATYVFHGFLYSPLLLFLFALTLSRLWRQRKTCRFEIVISIAQLLFIISAGGDEVYFNPHRLLYPLFPFLFRSSLLVRESFFTKSKILGWSAVILILLLLPANFRMLTMTPTCYYLDELRLFSETPSPMRLLRQKATELVSVTSWVNINGGEILAKIVKPAGGAGLSVASEQAGAFPVFWQGEIDDFHGILSPDYAKTPKPERERIFFNDPSDIIAVYRFRLLTPEGWGQGEIHFPTARTMQLMGYKPFADVEIIPAQHHWFGTILEYAPCSFLFFARNFSIINLEAIQWDGARPIVYSDETGTIKAEVPVKEIRLEYL